MGEAAVEKKKPEVEMVRMNDGRELGFVGKRKLIKETLIDESKIEQNGDELIVRQGALKIRCDFRNGESLTWDVPMGLLVRTAGHGGEQKLGDETAGTADVDDMVLDVADLIGRLDKGEWAVKRESSGFAGASIVVRAIMEATGKDQETVKAFLQRKLDQAEAAGQKLSRKELYDSFRAPNTKTAGIIQRLEQEKLAKTAKVDADAVLAEV